MDRKHNAIKELDGRAISDNRQRGAVKAIATFTGLGLRLYAGDDIPKEESNGNAQRAKASSAKKAPTTEKPAEAQTSSTPFNGYQSLVDFYRKSLAVQRRQCLPNGGEGHPESVGSIPKAKKPKTLPTPLPPSWPHGQRKRHQGDQSRDDQSARCNQSCLSCKHKGNNCSMREISCRKKVDLAAASLAPAFRGTICFHQDDGHFCPS